MAEMNFGGVVENVVTSKEFTLDKAREVLKNETIAVIGYGIQGPVRQVTFAIMASMSSLVSVRAAATRRLRPTVGCLVRHCSLLKRP